MTLFPYDWRLADGYPAKGVEYHGATVFGTFVCGGGSTMGYKLAGYKHLGGVEIDPKIATVYKANHSPDYLYIEDIRAFNNRVDLPPELYNLDLLDGSPPCSSFSMAGNREKDWGKNKVFAEGQAKQRLDDLVFEYIKTIEKLQPKVALLENVKGLVTGNAKSYAKKIKARFEAAGYRVQVFLLNAASMGVPQKRERVFFIGRRNDLDLPCIALDFNGKPIKFNIVGCGSDGIGWAKLTGEQYRLWIKQKPKDRCLADIRKAPNGFTDNLIADSQVCPTLTSGGKFICKKHPRHITSKEGNKISTFPGDYIYTGMHQRFIVGMSVPPVMAAQIAHQIHIQWLSRLPSEAKDVA